MNNTEIANTIKPLQTRFSFETFIYHLCIDSRSIIDPNTSIFIAIVGERNNGHAFINNCYQQGVRNFIISDESVLGEMVDCNYYLVPQTLDALQQLATCKRNQYKGPVIGITGSNGKTIVKDWASQILEEKYTVCKSPKSYNSQVGVALSVWKLSTACDLGIFEAGISLPGEMIRLQKMIQPSIGIFTNIGHAHDAGFESTEQKIREKLQLFLNTPTLVYCKDNPKVELQMAEWFQQRSPDTKLLSWSTKQNANLVITKRQATANHTLLQAIYNNQFLELVLPFKDDASVENIIHCWCLMLLLEFTQAEIQSRVNLLTAVAMRLELKEAINESVLIDDTYTNDLDSLRIGIDYLHAQPGNKKSIVLSDIQQSILSDEELYEQVSNLLKQKPLFRIVTVGKNMGRFSNLFTPAPLHFDSTNDLLADGCLTNIQSETILVKGARVFEFERISRVLQRKNHETILEVNLSALIHNYHYYKRQLNNEVKVMAMVKAFSYGSGSYEVASVLEYNHVDYFAVAYIDEGIELRKRGIKKPIMVMNVNFDSLTKLIEYKLEPEVYSIEKLQKLTTWLRQQNITPKGLAIHIKLDTGMHRLGFDESQVDDLVDILRMNQQLKVASIFSHLVASDDKQFDDFTQNQMALFSSLSKRIENVLGYSCLKHILNSGGISRFEQAQFNMVRLGIGMYGISSNQQELSQLENVCSLITSISQIRGVSKGDTVGYNRRGTLQQDSRIATIPIGYADGFRRSLGNGNYAVLVKGIECKTVGNICMDMCMIDVTNVDCSEGDEVIIFGQTKSINAYAAAMETIAYEALTSISERVKRVYLKE